MKNNLPFFKEDNWELKLSISCAESPKHYRTTVSLTIIIVDHTLFDSLKFQVLKTSTFVQVIQTLVIYISCGVRQETYNNFIFSIVNQNKQNEKDYECSLLIHCQYDKG